MSNRIKLYCDINNSNQLYNENGDLYGANDFALFFNNTSIVEIHYVTETTSSSDPAEWSAWTGLQGLQVASSAAFNDTRQHAYRGFTDIDYPQGTTTLTLRMESDSVEINYTDVLVIRNLNGTTTSFVYDSYTVDSEDSQIYTFTLSNATTVDIPQNTLVRVPQALLFKVQSESVDESQKDSGIFVFTIYVMSNRLHDMLDFSDTEVISGTFEHRIMSEGVNIRAFSFPVSVYNLLDYDESASIPPSNPEDEWASKQFVLSFFDSGLLFQFSTDGSAWHDVQTVEDTYFRIKSGLQGTHIWSDAIQIPSGTKGTDGEPGADGEDGAQAGFGTPVAYTETLNPDQSASVAVQATGEDTQKVFTFTFKIPKGKNGSDGKSYRHRGMYADNESYSYMDTVLYRNSLYLCVSTTNLTGVPPATTNDILNVGWAQLTTAINSTEILDPPVEFTVYDSNFGRVCALDSITSTMTYASPVYKASSVRLFLAPASAPYINTQAGETASYIALKVNAKGYGEQEFTTLDTLKIQVPTTPTDVQSVAIDLYSLNNNSYFTGQLQFQRDTSSVYDTLQDADGSKIQCIVLTSALTVIYNTSSSDTTLGDLYYEVIQGE